MRLLPMLSTLCLLAGCNARGRQILETGYWVIFGLMAVFTIVGLFALRRTVRALRRPDGHAVQSSLMSLMVVALPVWSLMPIIDDEPQWRVHVAMSAVMLYCAFLLFCLVLSIVRWVRTRA